jgi:hypothetical protein
MGERQWESKKGSSKEINVKFEKAGDTVEGFLMESLTDQGAENKSTIHTLKTADGEEKVFWGSMVIDEQLAKVSFGSYVMVKFLGKVKSAKGPYSYNSFEVFEDTAAEGVKVEAPVKQEDMAEEAIETVSTETEDSEDPF